MKFRVIAGNHAHGKYPVGHPWAGRSIVYERGEVIDTTINLAKFNIQGPRGPKFQRLADTVPATDKVQQGLEFAKRLEAAQTAYDGNDGYTNVAPPLPDDGFDALNLEELKKMAKEENIQLPAKATKEEVVTALRQAYAVA